MKLEKPHFQVFKTPKSKATKARCLSFEALMALEESNFQVAKMPNSA
jgi:hypothetical protein